MWTSEMKHQYARTGAFLGSPSLVRLPDGAILGTHDYFGPGSPKDHEGKEHVVSVYRSEDDGLTWWNVTHITGAYWSGLFLHEGAVYLLGTSSQFGSIVIRRSEDGGFTWTHPADESSGLLFRGGPGSTIPNYHSSSMPVLVHKGRVWRAFEDMNRESREWLRALVISAPADADLLDAKNWTMTNRLVYDLDADPPLFGTGKNEATWREGNVVADRDGTLWNILRVNADPVMDKAAMARIVDENTLEFDSETGFIDFPGGRVKFTTRYDETSDLYWSIVNDMSHTPERPSRNRLALSTSKDLRTWTLGKALLRDNLESDPEKSITNTGFQYVDWQFDGEDIIYMCRTAYDGAHNMHDANRMTFGRIKDFRLLVDND